MQKTDGRKLDHTTSETLRVMAVRRVLEDGETPSEVMDSMGMCRTTIYKWLDAHAEKGMEGLRSTKAAGPEPKLTPRQRKRVRRWIVGRDPRQYGFDFGLWTRRAVADMILGRFGVSLSLASVGRLLEELEITPQKPLRRAYERDPAAVEAWMRETFPRLKRRAKRRGAAIFFLDEAGFSSEPNLGATWGAKGETPVVRTSGQRQKVNAISAINARGAFWCDVYTGNLNSERFIGFLRSFMRGRGKVFLVLDGHPSHRSKKVREFVKSTKGRLELHFLPPYAPDLNPDEFVWQHAKRNGVAKRPLRRNESLLSRVVRDLGEIARDKALVASFFHAQSVAYAMN